MCEVFWAVQNSSWCFSPHLPVGCCGKQDYQSLSGDCAHTSQSGVDRRNRSGRRSEGMMGDSAADSLNRRCVGMSPGTLPSPETPAYRAGSVYLFLKNSFGMRRGLGLGLNFFFSQLPGRADFRGVGLTVFLGALWVTALRIQRFNHYTNTHGKQILNKKNWNASDIANVIFTSFPEQQQKMKISNLVLCLIPYQQRCQLFLPWTDKKHNYGLTVSRNLWIKGSLDHTISLQIYHIGTIPTAMTEM